MAIAHTGPVESNKTFSVEYVEDSDKGPDSKRDRERPIWAVVTAIAFIGCAHTLAVFVHKANVM